MYNSGISARSLLDGIVSETGIGANLISGGVVLRYLNTVEQLLYRAYIREERVVKIKESEIQEIDGIYEIGYDSIKWYNDAQGVREEEDLESIEESARQGDPDEGDIIAIYHGGEELSRGTAGSIFVGFRGSRSYYAFSGDKIRLFLAGSTESRRESKPIYIVYRVRPIIKTMTGTEGAELFPEDNIMVPYEFVDMLGSYVKGRMYETIGHTDEAARWLADYNTRLEDFAAIVGR